MSQKQTSKFTVDGTSDGDRPTSEIGVLAEAVRPSSDDEFLTDTNLGLGNYDDEKYYRQVKAFRMGLFADASFSRRLLEHAIEDAKRGLALEGCEVTDKDGNVVHDFDGWEDLDEEDLPESKVNWVEEQGDEIWKAIPERVQLEALSRHAGVTRQWTPPQWRLLMMRHEASRSLDARLIDNLFGRIKVFKGDKEAAEKKRLLERLR